MRHIISLKEQSKDGLLKILTIAQELKKKRANKEVLHYLDNQTLIMLFQKTSTRTRLSFEAAMTELGGHAIYLDALKTQMSFSDFKDEIRAMMRYGQVLMFRALKAEDVEYAASFNQVPVVDACSEKYHPCQALGDILTMAEYSGGVEKIGKVVWLGIENNVSNTLKLACAKLGIDIVLASPEADQASIDEELNKQAEKTGQVEITQDVKKAVKDAHFIHTDTWVNMEFFENGTIRSDFKDEFTRRKKIFKPYQVNAHLVETYSPKAKIMHCMPCHIGFEITRDAVDHKNSIIFDQAENRLHIQKAILLWLLERDVH